jgi:hypothetical protein
VKKGKVQSAAPQKEGLPRLYEHLLEATRSLPARPSPPTLTGKGMRTCIHA